MSVKSYREAGVDIEKGDRFAAYIGGLSSKAVSRGIGGFAGGVELDWQKYRQPVMLSATDGVGTKLMVAQKLKKYDTVGIDLVAMCVNDLAVCGADPQVFLDYIACGELDEAVMQDVIRGIVKGCEQADCVLAGGETAEMPDMYQHGDFDLAGFSVGLVEKDQMLPRKGEIAEGDQIFGLPSTGIHSNGLSLARKAIKADDEAGWQQLLTPTKIYVRELRELRGLPGMLGAAHITGGGLEGNLLRLMPERCGVKMRWDWDLPEVFDRIQKSGGIETEEMRRVFNMGIGMAIVVSEELADTWLEQAQKAGLNPFAAGEVVRG